MCSHRLAEKYVKQSRRVDGVDKFHSVGVWGVKYTFVLFFFLDLDTGIALLSDLLKI